MARRHPGAMHGLLSGGLRGRVTPMSAATLPCRGGGLCTVREGPTSPSPCRSRMVHGPHQVPGSGDGCGSPRGPVGYQPEKGGADSPAAPCLQPACSLPVFAAEHRTWGEGRGLSPSLQACAEVAAPRLSPAQSCCGMCVTGTCCPVPQFPLLGDTGPRGAGAGAGRGRGLRLMVVPPAPFLSP